jgi:hypothetical protein
MFVRLLTSSNDGLGYIDLESAQRPFRQTDRFIRQRQVSRRGEEIFNFWLAGTMNEKHASLRIDEKL